MIEDVDESVEVFEDVDKSVEMLDDVNETGDKTWMYKKSETHLTIPQEFEPGVSHICDLHQCRFSKTDPSRSM